MYNKRSVYVKKILFLLRVIIPACESVIRKSYNKYFKKLIPQGK